jgi:uncharacterized repeat protein (TIGR01451 family)
MGAIHRLDATCWRGGRVRAVIGLLALLAAVWSAPASAVTSTCGPAASQGVNGPADFATYCWIDFTGYVDATAQTTGGQAFTITLTGGSTLSFTLKVTGPSLAGTTVPTWTGAALGQSAFITIPGKPSLYQTAGAGTTTVTLSNLVLTVGSGTVPYAIVAADAESTNGGETLSFTTNGNPWTLLASMAFTGSTTFPTLSGTGTTTVTETGVAGNVGAYAFATQGSPTTITSTLLGSGLQGIAFAVKFHAVDFAITSSHSGSFNAGGTGSYTLTATNNGPDQYAPTDTVTVTDTLPTGESFVSASGTGWTCGAVGQLVTCTASNVTVNSGSSLPAITLNVSVASNAAASLTNTATVASNPNLDYNTANNTTTDVTTIVTPDFTTSTKTVVNPAGGDYLVGSTVQYTITLTESAGVAAVGASVTDDVPANLSGFTVVSIPSGATNSSTGAGTGANNDGKLNVTGINVPANGSVTIVFTAQVATGTATCTAINNTATVTTPNGTTGGATPSSNTVTVAQSACASSGNKILYVYDAATLTRLVQTANTGTGVTANGGAGTATWTLTPAVAKNLVISAGTVVVTLIETNTGASTGNARATTVTLLNNGASAGVSASTNSPASNAATVVTYTITLASAVTVNAGNSLALRLTNNGAAGRNVLVSQKVAAITTTTSRMSFAASTVINVDSVTAYSATYPSTTQPANGVFLPGQTVFICAVVSDPFGSADTGTSTGGTLPRITLTDPSGATPVVAAAMTVDAAANCAGTASTSTEAFEYSFVTTTAMTTGFWNAAVKAFEGAEGTVTHTANGSFDLDVPVLTIMKTVLISTDPIEGATRAKAIPGATAQYTITVQNSGRGPVDTGSMVLSDPVPTNTVMSLPAKPPFTFTDGGTTSGLSVTSGSDTNIVYSNNSGSTFVYTPACTRPCTDSAITNFKITLAGPMNGKIGAGTPSFTLSFNVVIQ